MSKKELSFQDFVVMILDVLKKSGIDYMIGGAIAVWPWDERGRRGRGPVYNGCRQIIVT